jgi:hypothetical protein
VALLAQSKPGASRLLAIHIAQHHTNVFVRAVSRNMCGNRAFATSSFAVDDGYDWHKFWGKLMRSAKKRRANNNLLLMQRYRFGGAQSYVSDIKHFFALRF